MPNRTYRRLIPPNINKNLKPGVNSKNFSLGGYQYSFKDFLLGKNMFSYRCVNRAYCKTIIHIPMDNYHYETLELVDSSNVVGIQIINQHSEICSEKLMEEEKESNSVVAVNKLGSDLKILEQFVRLNPLLEPKVIKAEMIKQNQNFKKFQIIKIIQEVRNELFPRNTEKVFTSYFCSALNSQEIGY